MYYYPVTVAAAGCFRYIDINFEGIAITANPKRAYVPDCLF